MMRFTEQYHDDIDMSYTLGFEFEILVKESKDVGEPWESMRNDAYISFINTMAELQDAQSFEEWFDYLLSNEHADEYAEFIGLTPRGVDAHTTHEFLEIYNITMNEFFAEMQTHYDETLEFEIQESWHKFEEDCDNRNVFYKNSTIARLHYALKDFGIYTCFSPSPRSWGVVFEDDEQDDKLNCEIITPPLTVCDDEDADLIPVYEAFEFIQETPEVTTTDRCALHFTLGTFYKYNEYNWLKFLIYYDAERALNVFSRTNHRFCVDRLPLILQKLKEEGINPLDNISVNKCVIDNTPKFSAVNFEKLRKYKIVEVRTVGGPEYEKREAEVSNEVNRALEALDYAKSRDSDDDFIEFLERLYDEL